MDCDQVARGLDRITEPGGAIVLAFGGAPGDLEPADWRHVDDEVRTRHLGPERRQVGMFSWCIHLPVGVSGNRGLGCGAALQARSRASRRSRSP